MALNTHRSGSTLPHLHIHSQCGACNRPFNRTDTLIATRFPGPLSSFLDEIYPVPPFRKNQNVQKNSRAIFCKAECSCSCDALGSATYHADCFNLFSRKCHAGDKYLRLWLAATRASPFRNAKPQKRLYDNAASKQLNVVFDLLGLKRLPVEMTNMIWAYDPASSHIIARFCSVLQLAEEMNVAPEMPSLCPLSEVFLWTRGQQHIVRKDMGPELPFLRITVDSRGLKKLERIEAQGILPRSQNVSQVSSDESENLFSKFNADFLFGLCILKL